MAEENTAPIVEKQEAPKANDLLENTEPHSEARLSNQLIKFNIKHCGLAV